MDALLHIAHRANGTLPLDLLAALTLLAVAPFILLMCTSFVRIIIVLSLVRSAIGTSALPPNALLAGLALVLTLVVMGPTFDQVQRVALVPYSQGKLSASGFVARATGPLRAFMLRQTHRDDLALFERIAHRRDHVMASVPLTVLLPAYVVGELRSAFAIGFALYLPFVVIDMSVAAILMGLGMMMLSPSVLSLPVKLLLFVMVDGWALVCGGVVTSFR